MIYDVLPVNSYRGNNSCTEFDFNFYIENDTQLEVYLNKADDTREKLILNVDYTINEVKNKNGSFIIYPIEGSAHSVLSEDEKISIELSLQFVQEIQYNNSSLLNLESLEYSFDYLTRLIQILQRRVDLCVKVTEGTDDLPKDYLDKLYSYTNICKQATEYLNETMPIVKEYRDYIEDNYNVINFIDRVDEIKTELDKFAYNDLSNVTIPYVIESYCSEDGFTYYRKWSDGYIEQNIYFVPDGVQECYGQVYLPVPLSTVFYNVQGKVIDASNTNDYVLVYTLSKTSFYWSTNYNGDTSTVNAIAFNISGF